MQDQRALLRGASTDTPLALLKRALHLLAVWTPKWTPEMRELKARVETLVRQVDSSEFPPSLSAARLAELQAKAARYDRLRALAVDNNSETRGFRVLKTVYANFDDAFDAELDAATAELQAIDA